MVRVDVRASAAGDGALVAVQADLEAGEPLAGTAYRLLEGRGILLRHFGEELRLVPGEAVRRATPAEPGEDLRRAA